MLLSHPTNNCAVAGQARIQMRIRRTASVGVVFVTSKVDQ